MSIDISSVGGYWQVMRQAAGRTNRSQTGDFQSLLVDTLLDSASSAGSDSVLAPGSSAMSYTPSAAGIFAGLLDSEKGMSAALLMLCMMLGGGSGSGDSFGVMMASLAGAISGLPGESQNVLRQTALQSGAPATVLEQVDNQVFGATSGASIPYQASKAVNPSVTSTVYNRSAALYRAVIDQFSVETNPRYAVNKRGKNDTYCNIFMWDVTRAMGAEIPHYVNPDTLEPMYYPNVKGARELNANGIYDWLGKVGGQYGWVQVTAEQAQNLANQGKPVVTAMRNNSGHGHVQVVCPSKDGVYDPERGVTIAQAGRNLYNYAPITRVYRASLPRVVYYAHA